MSSTSDQIKSLAKLYHGALKSYARVIKINTLDNSLRDEILDKVIVHANKFRDLVDHLAPLATEETSGEYLKSAGQLDGGDDSA